MRSMVLHLLTSHDIVSLFAKEGRSLTAEEISALSDNKFRTKYLERMLRYAASLGIVTEEDKDGKPAFGRSLVTDLLQIPVLGVTKRSHILWQCGTESPMEKALQKKADFVLKENEGTPVPFEVANGKNVFPFLMSNPHWMQIFQA